MAERGRPKKEDARRGQYRLRTDATDEMRLRYICEVNGFNKAEAIREALRVLYNLDKARHSLDIQ